MLEQLPEPTIKAMVLAEYNNEPIILKTGQKAYPKGWLRFFKIKPKTEA
jgi:hypothetical protein